MEFESPIFKAPSIPKISRRNISSSVIRGAEAVSTTAAPKLNRSKFSFFKKKELQVEKESLKIESNQNEILLETNRILVEIQNQLAIDFATRIAERKQAVRGIKIQTERDKASRKEQSLESLNKFNKGVLNQFDKITAPAKNIFQKLMDFFSLVVSGIVVNTAFTWLSDKNNQKKLSDTLSFVGKYWKEIVGTLIGLQLISTIASLVSAFQVAAALLTNPLFLTAIAGILAYKVSVDKEEAIIKERERLNIKDDKSIVTPEEFKKGERPSIQQLYYEQIMRNPTGAFGIGVGNNKGGTIPSISHPSFLLKANTIKQYPNIIQRFSDGGSVGGDGSQNVDSVPAMLAPGEEVIRTSSANLFRPLLKDINDNAGRTWYTFSQGVREMLDGNKMLRAIVFDLQFQLETFKNQLDKFSTEIRLGKIKNNKNPGAGPVVPNAFPMISDRGMEEIIPSSSVKQLKPIIKAINVERTRKSKRSLKEPIIIPMSQPPIIQGGGDELVQPSGGTATEQPSVGSVNITNPYMRITSEIYGIFV